MLATSEISMMYYARIIDSCKEFNVLLTIINFYFIHYNQTLCTYFIYYNNNITICIKFMIAFTVRLI